MNNSMNETASQPHNQDTLARVSWGFVFERASDVSRAVAKPRVLRSISPSLIVVGLLTALAAIIVRRRFVAAINSIPGPFAASFTRLWHVYQILKGKQNQTWVNLHEKHGHFVRISHDEVSVSHPDALKALFLKPVSKAPWYSIFVFPDWRFPAAISIREPKEKAEFMKYMSNAGFLMHNVIRYEDVIDELVEKLLDWMDIHAASRAPFDLSSFFIYVSFDITGAVTFSQPFGFIDQGRDVDNSIRTNMGLSIFLSIFGFYQHASYLFNNPLMTWLGILPVGHMVNTSISALNERRKNPDASFDMAAHWFRGLDKAKKEGYKGFTEKHVLSAAVANLGAGSDTVSCGMQTFVYCLIRKPELWLRVREEIEAAKSEKGRCDTRVITWEDASKLPFLEACIKESLRFMSPVPMGLPRIAPKGGLVIGNTHFAEGTCLSVNPHVMHHSKEIWGPDAHEFNPDRWFAPDIAAREKYLMPWGVGWASCPGQQLSKVQMFKILATIVRDYDIKQVNPEQEWKWAAYFTLSPRDWPVYISKREHVQSLTTI